LPGPGRSSYPQHAALPTYGAASAGELIGYQQWRDDEGGWLYQPVFRFPDASGSTLTATNPRSIWVVHQPPAGQQFDLIYNPDNPARIWRDSWREVWFGPIVLWLVFLLGLVEYIR
jgi:hypothetical protein